MQPIDPNHIPSGGLYLTDSGLETTLVFHHGLDLPHFAAFPLLCTSEGTSLLREYYRAHAAIARKVGLGFVAEAPTWRAHRDWGERLGYDAVALAAANTAAIELMREIVAEVGDDVPVVVSGNIGPRYDAYKPDRLMTVREARDYHAAQVNTFRMAGADMASTLTLAHSEEGAGAALAARDAGLPVAVGFTVETDGRLPSGETLAEAVRAVDGETQRCPIYYVVNCAHPDHVLPALGDGGSWRQRIGGFRGNASRCSHAELDDAETLDSGDPAEFAASSVQLRGQLPHLRVLGGCCGTDLHHIACLARALRPAEPARRVA